VSQVCPRRVDEVDLVLLDEAAIGHQGIWEM
jgi:hypothetical protein